MIRNGGSCGIEGTHINWFSDLQVSCCSVLFADICCFQFKKKTMHNLKNLPKIYVLKYIFRLLKNFALYKISHQTHIIIVGQKEKHMYHIGKSYVIDLKSGFFCPNLKMGFKESRVQQQQKHMDFCAAGKDNFS